MGKECIPYMRRGEPEEFLIARVAYDVFPTCVGVYRTTHKAGCKKARIPYMRRGEPLLGVYHYANGEYSLHA